MFDGNSVYCLDLQQLIQQEIFVQFFNSSETADNAKRAITWGIYLAQKGELSSARDAFMKAGEYIQTQTMNEKKKMSISPQYQAVGEQNINLCKELFRKIIEKIESVDEIFKSLLSTNTTPRGSSNGNITNSNNNNATTSSTTHNGHNEGHNDSTGDSHIEKRPNEKRKWKGKDRMSFSFIRSSGFDLDEMSEEERVFKQNLRKQEEEELKKQEQQKNVQNLQARLSTLLEEKNALLKSKTAATIVDLQEEARKIFDTAASRLPKNNTIPETVHKLLVLLEALTSIGSNIESTPIMVSFLKLLQAFHKPILKYINDERSNPSIKLIDRMDVKIFQTILRKTFEIENNSIHSEAAKVRNVTNEIEEIRTLYSQFFEISPSVYKLCILMNTVLKFDHTKQRLNYLYNNLQDLKAFLQKTRLSPMELQGLENICNLLNATFKSRIVDLTTAFGVDAYATVTVDFDEDPLASLEKMLHCIELYIEIENTALQTQHVIESFLINWLKDCVRKVYIINSENIRLSLENKLDGYNLKAARIIKLCEFCTKDSAAIVDRFGNLMNNYVPFTDIIFKEFSLHLYADIDRFCSSVSHHQTKRLKSQKDFDFSLEIFRLLCPKVQSTYTALQKRSSIVKEFPMNEKFYEVIKQCILQIPGKLRLRADAALADDKECSSGDFPHTQSSITIMTDCLRPVRMIYELDTLVRPVSTKKTKNLVFLYIEFIADIIKDYTCIMKKKCERELVEKKRSSFSLLLGASNNSENFSDKLRKACLFYNNIYVCIMYFSKAVADFASYWSINHMIPSSPTQIQNDELFESFVMIDDEDILDEEEDEVIIDVEEDEEDSETINQNIRKIREIPCLKSMLKEIQTVKKSIAEVFSAWVQSQNDEYFKALIGKSKQGELIREFLENLDRFFVALSVHLQFNLLHVILKALFGAYVQHLLRTLLPRPSIFRLGYNHNRVRDNVKECLYGLKELFNADGDGIPLSYLDKTSRQLEIILRIYHDDTSSLIALYRTLSQQQQQFNALSPIYKGNNNTRDPCSPIKSPRNSSIVVEQIPTPSHASASISIDRSMNLLTTSEGTANSFNSAAATSGSIPSASPVPPILVGNSHGANGNAADYEDSDGAMSDLSDSSIESIQKLTARQLIRDQYLSPELIYLLLSLRKSDKAAKSFVKEVRKKHQQQKQKNQHKK